MARKSPTAWVEPTFDEAAARLVGQTFAQRQGVDLSAGLYILDDQDNPVPEPDPIRWGRWLEKNWSRRTLAVDYPVAGEEVKVSTVFLAVNHNWSPGGLPILWETMIFGGEHNDFQVRYTDRQTALEGHEKAVQLVKGEAALGENEEGEMVFLEVEPPLFVTAEPKLPKRKGKPGKRQVLAAPEPPTRETTEAELSLPPKSKRRVLRITGDEL